jgi:hypothetical protein
VRKQLSPRGIFERSITEEDIAGAMTTLLELNGARVFPIIERIPWGRKTSTPGMPDLYGYFYRLPMEHPGLVLPIHWWVEVKRPGGKRRPAQIAWIDERRRDGVIAFFADSVEAMVKGFAEYGIILKGLQ